MTMPPQILALPLLLLAPVSAWSAEPGSPPPRLDYAIASDDGGVLASALPSAVVVDWEALAKAAIKEVDFDRPTAQDRKRLATRRVKGALDPEDVQVGFDAPLPPELASFSFYLMTDAGLSALRPARLCGGVRLGYDPKDREPRGTASSPEAAYFGSLCFEKGPKVHEDMVLMVSAPVGPPGEATAPIEPKVEKLGPKQTRLTASVKGESLVYEWAEPDKKPLTLRWGVEHGPRPVLQYRVGIAGRPPLLYVRWSKEPSQIPCSNMATLFELGERLEKVLSFPGCDFSPTTLPVELQ